ncbi:hypothetical protein Tco_0771004 [Tanacetum coccineum]|uniref:Uncharacterized protein n=1 Tax=Tanacetum coccineum TaxID=301880 RepID=A0ABQ4ZHK2_9ASTR
MDRESAKNGEWVKISMGKVHTLLDMEDNDERTSFINYLCIDLNYVEEQKNNLLLEHKDLIQELNTCKEQRLVLKQAKHDFITMQHVNTETFKEKENFSIELKGSNKVNQCISEQIPNQKEEFLGLNQITEDLFSSGETELTSIKFSSELQKADSSVPITKSSVNEYDSADECFCCTSLSSIEKLVDVEPDSGLKIIKSILKSKSTFKAEFLKGYTKNETTLTPAKVIKSVSDTKKNSALAEKHKSVKSKDDFS